MNEILAIIVSCSSLLIAGANLATFMIIKFNDMKHLEEGSKRIENTLTTLTSKFEDVAERIAKVEGTCAARKDCK